LNSSLSFIALAVSQIITLGCTQTISEMRHLF